MLSWENDSQDIIKVIESRPAFAKIILKTKDEPEFLREWIDHHGAIVGAENLIIADNGSTDPKILDIYQEVNSIITVFSYNQDFNLLHHPEYFSDLYRAIFNSCEMYSLLDTDERLVLIEDGSWANGNDVLAFLKRHADRAIIPASLVSNCIGNGAVYQMYPDPQFTAAWTWGKPFVATRRDTFEVILKSGHVLHNCQYPSSLMTSSPLVGNLMVQHLCNLNRNQRISANVKKMIAMGFVSPQTSIDEIAKMSLDDPGPQRRFIYEICKMLEWNGEHIEYTELPDGAVRFCPGGRLLFSDGIYEERLKTFLASANIALQNLFNTICFE